MKPNILIGTEFLFKGMLQFQALYNFGIFYFPKNCSLLQTDLGKGGGNVELVKFHVISQVVWTLCFLHFNDGINQFCRENMSKTNVRELCIITKGRSCRSHKFYL